MNDVESYKSPLLNEEYYKVKHKSGLEINVYPKDMSTTYGILAVRFGGNITSYEKNGKIIEIPQGCAHFLEHKMFDNPDGTNADEIFSSLGAYSNAYTSNDATAYLFSTTDKAEECLSQLIYFVNHPYFTEDTVKKEMGIIAEEIRGCKDDPYDRCYLNLLDGMYFNNPVKNEICGSEESISRITPEILYGCCEDFYIPSNMILSVCGNITLDAVLRIVDRELGDLEHKLTVRVCDFSESENVRSDYCERTMQVGNTIFAMGVKDVNIPEDALERYKRAEAINILLHTMFSESGNFYMQMLEEGLLSPGFDFGYSANSKTAYIMMSGESDDPVMLLEKIKEQIKKCRETGIHLSDFEREKKCMYASYVADFDSTEDIAFLMNSYSFEKINMFAYPDMINSIDLDYVSRLIKEIFKDEYFSLSVVKP